LSFDFKILSINESKNPIFEEGCTINGLYLEGARWDEEKGTLAESFPKVLIYNMPDIQLIPKVKKEEDEQNKVFFFK